MNEGIRKQISTISTNCNKIVIVDNKKYLLESDVVELIEKLTSQKEMATVDLNDNPYADKA